MRKNVVNLAMGSYLTQQIKDLPDIAIEKVALTSNLFRKSL